MVQRELKQKTKHYTLAAVLAAIILASAIYAATTPTAMYSLIGATPMKSFASIDELREYLITNTTIAFYPTSPLGGGATLGADFSASGLPDMPAPAPDATVAPTAAREGAFTVNSYSTTNVQVAGVDEIDVVKTDGTYIYTLNNDAIHIVRADPQNPAVVGKIVFDPPRFVYITGMYLSENGNKLAVLCNDYNFIPYLTYDGTEVNESTVDATFGVYYFGGNSHVYVYDVSDKTNPVLTRDLTLSGNYMNSRRIGNYLYIVANQPAYATDEFVTLPQIRAGTVMQEIAPTSIYYTDMQDSYFSYTTFAGINLLDDKEQATSMTILMSSSSCMYVSTDNMYLTFPRYETETTSTEIYRVAIDGAKLTFKAQNIIPGYILNQYSMDEYSNHFRVATTVSTGFWPDRTEYNNLYVLNMNLNIVGKIENLAQGERIYSARFAGDKAYLVTFKQIDPFFVLDLKNPTSPKVAGELKIPGFSSYLHPYNENYIIGIGKEDTNVKLSLFDVTNINNPTEIAKYIIGENADYTDTCVLYEPKAFLFNPQKQLIVLPISITKYNYIAIPQPITDLKPEPRTSTTPSPTPTPIAAPIEIVDSIGSITSDMFIVEYTRNSYWLGAYALKVSPENGFTLQKEISHLMQHSDQWYGYNSIDRSLYIGNTLYTISYNTIQLHSLDNFDFIAQVNL
jgi:uncharacterized secreted protein with C-terminal beta-propeller domain